MTEAELQNTVEKFLVSQNAPHIREFKIQNSRVDFALLNNHEDKQPIALLEIKNNLSEKSKLADLADYFEQCLKYHAKSGLPIFLGVFDDPYFGAMKYFTGGERHKATAGFSAFGGRVNIGVCAMKRYQNSVHEMTFYMRQQMVAKFGYCENQCWFEDLKMIEFNNAASQKVRK